MKLWPSSSSSEKKHICCALSDHHFQESENKKDNIILKGRAVTFFFGSNPLSDCIYSLRIFRSQGLPDPTSVQRVKTFRKLNSLLWHVYHSLWAFNVIENNCPSGEVSHYYQSQLNVWTAWETRGVIRIQG